MNEKSIKIGDLNISFYEDVKDPNTKNYIIFLHGWKQNKDEFTSIFGNNLKDNVISLDLPGVTGRNDPRKALSVYDYADLITTFIKMEKIESVKLVAHSFGARISFILASRRDVHITKMILTGPAGITPKRDFNYRARVLGYKFQKLLVKSPFYFQYQEDLLKGSGSSDYKNSTELEKQILIKAVNEDLSYLFKNIKIPVILFWGKNDDQTPLEDSKIMKSLIQNTKLIVKDGDHFVFLNYIEEFSNLVFKA